MEAASLQLGIDDNDDYHDYHKSDKETRGNLKR